MTKKVFAVLLALAVMFSILPTVVSASGYSDMPNDWSTTALEKAVENGLLAGNDGKIMPKSNLTRAQLGIILNNAFGAVNKASLSNYSDVSEKAWYYEGLGKAVQMGTISPEGNKLNPNKIVTREEVFTALAKLLKLKSTDDSVLNKYSDKDTISQESKYEMAAMVSAGYITGSAGKLNPKKNITRAEFAKVMENVLGNYIRSAGTYTKNLNGNVIISVPGVTLKNIKINGDLIIGDGVGDGEVTLDGVTVTGRTVVRGGGESSIKIVGKSNVSKIIVARVDGKVRVYTEDGTSIGEVVVDGSDDVIIEGTVENLTILTSDITVNAKNATIKSVKINGEKAALVATGSTTIKNIEVNAKSVTITANAGTKIDSIVVNKDGANINGAGKVGSVTAKANNVKVTTAGTVVSAAPGTTGVIAGTTNVPAGGSYTVPGGSSSPSSGGSSPGGGGGSPSGGGNNGNNPGTDKVLVESISITPVGDLTITKAKGTLQLSAEVLPAKATNKAVKWSIDKGEGLATISEAGLVTAKANGEVTVMATAKDGSNVSATKKITISGQGGDNSEKVLVKSIKITCDITSGGAVTVTGSAITITEDMGSVQLFAEVKPDDATDKTVTWSITSGGAIAIVSDDGFVQATSNGAITVRATANDGSGVYADQKIIITGQLGDQPVDYGAYLAALRKIGEYADDESNPAPTLKDYKYAGVTGVDFNNLEAVNITLALATKTYVDTFGVQVIVNAATAKANFFGLSKANFKVDNGLLALMVEGILTEEIATNKLKYASSQAGTYSVSLTGTYANVVKVDNDLNPGEYSYSHIYNGNTCQTIIILKLADKDLSEIKGLQGFGNTNDEKETDILTAADGWYPGATGATKNVKTN